MIGDSPLTRPKRYFLDTEFTEDGPERPVDLISLALVDEYGGEFHRVLSDFDRPRAEAHEFVGPHVLPLIDKVDRSLWRPRAQVRAELCDFVGLDRTEPIHLWAWYAAYDGVTHAQLHGTMMQLPQPAFPMFVRDLKQEVERIEEAAGQRMELWSPPEGAHDALVDARTLRVRYQQVAMFARSCGVDGPQ
jgi:hypothetical protein